MGTIGISFVDDCICAFYGENGQTRDVRTRDDPTRCWREIHSYIEFNNDGEPIRVGEQAYRDYLHGTGNTIVWGMLSLVGLSFEEARRVPQHLDYPLARREDNSVVIPIGPSCYTPADIIALLLKEVKHDALEPLVNDIEHIDRVVVAFPPNIFGIGIEQLTQAVRNTFAELPAEAIVLVPESVAAIRGGQQLPGVACIINMGSGRLDVNTAELRGYNRGEIEYVQKSSCSITGYGGSYIDDILLEWVISDVFQRVRPAGDATDTESRARDFKLARLRSEIEIARIILSNADRVETVITYQGSWVDITIIPEILYEPLDKPLPSDKLREWVGDYTREEIKKAMQAIRVYDREEPSFLDLLRLTISDSVIKGGYTIRDINHVVLIGSSLYIPCTREAIHEIFYKTVNFAQIERRGIDFSPGELAARGASQYSQTPPRIENIYHTLSFGEFEGPYSKTWLRYVPDLFVKTGDSLPAERTKTFIFNPLIRDEPVIITFLRGIIEYGFGSHANIIWERSKPLYFKFLMPDSRSQVTISLKVDESQQVSCDIHADSPIMIYTDSTQSAGVELKEGWYRLTPKMIERLDSSKYRVVPFNSITA